MSEQINREIDSPEGRFRLGDRRTKSILYLGSFATGYGFVELMDRTIGDNSLPIGTNIVFGVATVAVGAIAGACAEETVYWNLNSFEQGHIAEPQDVTTQTPPSDS